MKTFASFRNPNLEWKKENLGHSTRDISVLIPEGADPEVILGAINTNTHLAASEISDIYKVPESTETESVETVKESRGVERLAVTYRITIFGDCDTDSVETEVTALLCGFGCLIREKDLRIKE